MKRSLLAVLVLLFFTHPVFAQDAQGKKYTILMSGASFASADNGWFELGCGALGAIPVNKAVGGEAIANTANRMENGSLYSTADLDDIDVFVIMQVHNVDVFNSSGLHDNYKDYPLPFDRSDYAAAYDYVIKRYISECYELKDNPDSRYFNSPGGKPAVIVLCTHWHDGRPVYNNSIRQLAGKWGLPLVEFDTGVGFSVKTKHPVTGRNFSLLYAKDKESIDGEDHGWHPQQGKDAYIQQRMAAVFADAMRAVLPLK